MAKGEVAALRQGGGDIKEWKPHEAKVREAQAEAVKEYARAVLDWDMLNDAVDQQISDQRNLVEWWGEHVSPRDKNRKLRAAHGVVSEEAAEKESGITHQKVSKWRRRLGGDLAEYRALLRGPSYRKAMGDMDDSQLVQQSLSAEHYTPQVYVDAAREVLGAIDLDPASCAEHNETVKATKFYTEADNGLEQPWRGRALELPLSCRVKNGRRILCLSACQRGLGALGGGRRPQVFSVIGPR